MDGEHLPQAYPVPAWQGHPQSPALPTSDLLRVATSHSHPSHWEGAPTELGMRFLWCGGNPPTPVWTCPVTHSSCSCELWPKSSYKGGHTRRPYNLISADYLQKETWGWTWMPLRPLADSLVLRTEGEEEAVGSAHGASPRGAPPSGGLGFWVADPLAQGCGKQRGQSRLYSTISHSSLASARFGREKKEEVSSPSGLSPGGVYGPQWAPSGTRD